MGLLLLKRLLTSTSSRVVEHGRLTSVSAYDAAAEYKYDVLYTIQCSALENPFGPRIERLNLSCCFGKPDRTLLFFLFFFQRINYSTVQYRIYCIVILSGPNVLFLLHYTSYATQVHYFTRCTSQSDLSTFFCCTTVVLMSYSVLRME